MRLRARELWKLRQIGKALREEDPGLDTLLAGRAPPRRPASRVRVDGILAGYLVPPGLLLAGLVLDATWLVVVGAALCPFVPVTAWLLIRRRFTHG